MTGVDLTGADLTGADLTGVTRNSSMFTMEQVNDRREWCMNNLSYD